jgi:hypothetical protein
VIEQADHAYLARLKDAIYSFALFGMTQQMQVDMKAVATAIVIGGVSAVGGSYLTARDNARELAVYAKAQEEFRIEMRQYMRESAIEMRSMNDRLTRQEIMTGMSGNNGQQSGMNNGKR